MIKKKIRSVVSVVLLVITSGLLAQAVVAKDFFKIDACEGDWWVDFYWTIDGAFVQFETIDCDNNTAKVDITRTGSAVFANDFHFAIFDNHNGSQAACFFNGEFEAGTTGIRKITCKRGPDLLYKGDLKINPVEAP